MLNPRQHSVRPNNRRSRHIPTCLILTLLGGALGGCASSGALGSSDGSPTRRAFGRMQGERGEGGLAGLSTPPLFDSDAYGQPRTGFTVATLGAGDSLGRAIYINDIMLAAADRLREPATVRPRPGVFVTVPESDPD